MPPSGPMNLESARVVNQPLTIVAQGYEQAATVRNKLFPIVPVDQRGGKVLEFKADDFLKYNTKRAPGATRERASFGYGDKDYVIVQRALDATVTREEIEEAKAGPGIDLQLAHVDEVMSIMDMQLEIEAAELATTVANYSAAHHQALAANKRWDRANTTPNKDIETARQKIMQGVGIKPNVLVLGPKVFGALCNNKDVLDSVRPTEGLREDGKPTVNEMKLASYFDVDEVVVGYAMTGKPGNFEFAWGDVAILAYTRTGAAAHRGRPTFGYCYRLNGYPMVEEGWWDKTVNSWIYPATVEETHVIAAKDAGFLYTTVIG